MNSLIVKKRNSFVYRAISLVVAIAFFATAIIPPSYAQSITALNLPMPGVMVAQSPAFVPVLLKGMTIHPEDPFRFDFIVDSGNTVFTQDEIKKESEKLVKYFLASMTIPKDDLWVNLSPYESDRIIPDELGKTELGRDMLAQDYLLKQLTASLMYPEDELGSEFWTRVYAMAQEKFGTSEILMNTFNKVWIIPDSATVFENDKTVYVVESKLKVMLDSDYQAMMHSQQENLSVSEVSTDFSINSSDPGKLSSQIIREIILPAIEKEVNEGKNFAPLRQIYHSLILSKWYKETIKNSLLSKVYIDQKKTAGVELDDKTIKDQIYEQYMQAYKKGVFDFIKEDYDQLSQEVIPRKYFSGGLEFEGKIPLKKTAEADNFDAAMVGDNYGLSLQIKFLGSSINEESPKDNGMISKEERIVSSAASVLSQQDANIVFEKDRQSGRWLFRRGPIDLEIDGKVAEQFGNILEAQGYSSMLLVLRNHDFEAIKTAITQALQKRGDIGDIFSSQGITVNYNYKRVLLVAPFGDMNGDPLKYKVPHKGVEIIAHELIRSANDVDALVYNPNLGSREGLYEFVQNNHFDIIGVSVLQAVLKANLEILGQLSLISPDSIFVAGGNELNRFPLGTLAKSWPIDVISFNSGESLLRIVNNYSRENSKQTNLEGLENVSNIALNDGDTFIRTKSEKDQPLILNGDIESEIAYDKPDLVHHGHYDAVETTQEVPIAFDRIGRKPTRIPLGDYCKGRCIFCGTTRNKRRDSPPEKVIELIAKADPSNDGIHFESADFLYDPASAQRLAGELARIQQVKRIPKLAIARVDEVGDGTVINRMAQAGFKIIAFGVESFDNKVLSGIGKDTTAQDNIKALDIAVQEGIKPGINLILFTPWDTVDTTLKTIDISLRYMAQGAYINVVPYLFAGFGRKMSRMEGILDYETYDFPGLKEPFRFPRLSKIFDSQLAGLRDRVYSKVTEIEEASEYPEWAKRSVSVYSLLIYKAFIETLREEGLKEPGQLNQYIERIDEAIQRVIRSEESTMKAKEMPSAVGVAETWFNPFNQLLTTAILNTEDGRKIKLRITDDYPGIPSDGKLPGSMIYNIYVVENVNGKDVDRYKGWLEIQSDDHINASSYKVVFRRTHEADVFIHRGIAEFSDTVQENSSFLIDQMADYRKTGPGLVPHFHRIPSEPLFGETISQAATQNISRADMRNQVEATYNQGYIELADALSEQPSPIQGDKAMLSRFAPPFNLSNRRNLNVHSLLSPSLAISDMDLTQFPPDEEAPRVMRELAEKALKYKSAAISVYPDHLDYLPVDELKQAGVHIGVVVAFPQGLAHIDIDQELKILEEAVLKGADEVDFVIDFKSIINGNPIEAEKSLAKFALGVEEIKLKHNKPLRIKAILETTALKTAENIRMATSIALKYADLIKMVSGFPVGSDNNQRGTGSLFVANIILNEILYYYKRTGILRAMKITGGINEWDNSEQPDRSARQYYNLVFQVLGRSLGYHYIFERDLFRIGGYGSLATFLDANSQEPFIVPNVTRAFDPDTYEDLTIPVSQTETSLNLEEYLSSKFPTELQNVLKEKSSEIEIHRGSISTSESYIQYLIYQGYEVAELMDAKASPPHHRFDRLEKDGKVKYVIAGLLGSARELFILQAMVNYYQFPSGLISFREFDEGKKFDAFNDVLENYAGQIKRAVLLHEIDNYFSAVTQNGDVVLDLVERIKTDFVDAIVARTANGELVLLFEMQYANGSHAGKVVEYLTASVRQKGLGVKDITLHGVSGGIGEGVKINDLVVYDDIYWKGNKLDNIPKNDVDKERLRKFLPQTINLYEIPIYDIPTVLNGSIVVMDQIETTGDGVVELEAAHAAIEVAKHEDVTFRAFYEVHDKPATTASLSKADAIGDDIAGYRDPEKRRATWIALARYLFGEDVSIRDEVKELTPKQSIQNAVARDLHRSQHHAVDVIQSRLINRLSNIVFLGQGHGLAYFGHLKDVWDREQGELLYWDAKEHIALMEKGMNFLDMLPYDIGSDTFFDTQRGSYSNRIIFIDNIDEIIKRPHQREYLHFFFNQQKDVPIIGYVSSREYAQVERVYTEAREDFNDLNFELTQETNPSTKGQSIVVLGATGLVGLTIMSELEQKGYANITGSSLHGDETRGIKAVDLTNPEALRESIRGADVVINASVDLNFPGMQKGGEEREKAHAVNVGILRSIKESGFSGKVIQLSSFYVFGHNDAKVFSTTSPDPISVYGQHKLEAEEIVGEMEGHIIVRLGSLFGLDTSGRQKGFYKNVVEHLEKKRAGQQAEPINTTTYPTSPIVSVEDISQGVVSLLETDFRGISQLSGAQSLSSVEQARLIEEVFNSKFGTDLSVNMNIEEKERMGSLTPDVIMYSQITPDLRKAVSQLIDDVLNEISGENDPAMMGDDFTKGGIDMNEIDVERQGSGVDIHFDPAMMQNMLDQGVDGFVPVIINLTPINSVMPFLGLEPRNREEEYAFSGLN